MSHGPRKRARTVSHCDLINSRLISISADLHQIPQVRQRRSTVSQRSRISRGYLEVETHPRGPVSADYFLGRRLLSTGCVLSRRRRGGILYRDAEIHPGVWLMRFSGVLWRWRSAAK